MDSVKLSAVYLALEQASEQTEVFVLASLWIFGAFKERERGLSVELDLKSDLISFFVGYGDINKLIKQD